MNAPRRLLLTSLLAVILIAPAAPAQAQPAPGPSVPSHTARPSDTFTQTSVTAAAAVKVPGSLTGLGFDTCQAPDQETMDTLRRTSPFWGVGVYIGGEERSCNQPNLTAGWVGTQAGKGWRIFPVWAGRQSHCSDVPFDHEIARRNARAADQGRSAANRAVNAATSLGMARGSTLFLDVEAYDNTTSECNQPVMHFQSAWSTRLHRLGWKSGFYSSAASGITALDHVRATFPGTYEMPDAIWFSHANGKATTDGGQWVRDEFWTKQRLHQYVIDEVRSYGGVTLAMDLNAIRIGRGSVAPAPGRDCGGVRLTFASYRQWQRGDTSPQVKTAQCLLRQQGLYSRPLVDRFNLATARAVRQLQDRRGLATTGRINAPTWTVLLSSGTRPLVKRGSASDRVRFLQRALTAALAEPVRANGVFGAGTTRAVTRYQWAVGHSPTGVVTTATWKALQRGAR